MFHVSRVILLMLIARAAGAAQPVELSLSLPLGPYYRPGKYIPVHIKVHAPDGIQYWVGVHSLPRWENHPSGGVVGQGAGRSSVQMTEPRIDVVIPWLVMDARAKRPRLFVETRSDSVDGPELVQLGDSERMVGHTGTFDEAFAKELIGARQIIPIQLDPAMPIRGHAATWEMLDALILDADAAKRLDQGHISAMLSCGMTLAVKTDSPPFANWPWRKIGAYHVLRHAPMGPVTVGYNADVYKPVQNWETGWPWAQRRRILVFAAILCIAVLALALWRPPLAWLWTLALVGLTIAGLKKFWEIQVTFQQAGGEVIVIGEKLTQSDMYTYQTAARPSVTTLRWSHVTKPVFASRRGFDDLWISLNSDTTGKPSEFDIRLPPKMKLAFVSRNIGPLAPSNPPSQPITSPLREVAQSVYAGTEMMGELKTAPPSPPAYGYVDITVWDAVVVKRR